MRSSLTVPCKRGKCGSIVFCATDGSGSRKFGSAQSVNQADSDLRGRYARARGDGRHAGDACADRDVELRHNTLRGQVCGISIIIKLVFQNIRRTLSVFIKDNDNSSCFYFKK